jgi:thymidine phosphorylase
MSKKLAEDLSALVLDVKVGEGAFLPDEDRALELARTMVSLGTDHGVPTNALLSAMDRPLGRAVGNALESAEAFACLAGDGPDDLRTLVIEIAAEMAVAGGVAETSEAARGRAAAALSDGRALAHMERMVEAQGGDPRVVADPDRLPRAPCVREVRAERGGRVVRVRPLELGHAVIALGGGRVRLGEAIDHRVGFVLGVAPGDDLAAGDLIGEVHAADEDGAAAGRAALARAVELGSGDGAEAPPRPLISHRVTAAGVADWRA